VPRLDAGTHVFSARKGSVTSGEMIPPKPKQKCRACMYGRPSSSHIPTRSALPPVISGRFGLIPNLTLIYYKIKTQNRSTNNATPTVVYLYLS